MRVWLDDQRPAPEGWVRCHTVEQVKDLLLTGRVVDLALDHDLGDSYPHCGSCVEREGAEIAETLCGHRPSGYDLALWMAENDVWSMNPPTSQSDNPVGRRNILATVERYFPGKNPGQ